MESILDEPEALVEPDEEERPEPDEVEEEPEPSPEEEPEETKAPKSAEVESDSSVESGGEAEVGSVSEELDIDIFDGNIEPLEPDSDGQAPDSTVEHEPDDVTTDESGAEQESSGNAPTSERQIPYALDPEGNEVHVDEAEEGHPNICPECEGPLELRTSDKIRDYFAHEWDGWTNTNVHSDRRVHPWKIRTLSQHRMKYKDSFPSSSGTLRGQYYGCSERSRR